jgi:hypothetical protein
MGRRKGSSKKVGVRSVPFDELLSLLNENDPLRRPPTPEELKLQREREELERKREARLEYFLSYVRPRVQETNRLLFADELPEETLAALRKLEPLGHHRDCPAPDPPASLVPSPHRKCWAWLLQPLAFWPSDLIRIHGPILLYHPLIAETIRRLSKRATDPRLRENPDPVERMGRQSVTDEVQKYPEEEREQRRAQLSRKDEILRRGWSAISGLEEPFQQFVLMDETEDREIADEAREELRKVFQLLTNRVIAAKPKRHRGLRTLLEFQRRRERGVPEKKAVAAMAREGWGASQAAIRADIQRARKQIGKRTYPEHHRGRFRHRDS